MNPAERRGFFVFQVGNSYTFEGNLFGMRKHLLLVGCLVLSFDFSFAQTAPAIEWQNTIGGDKIDDLTCIQQTTDGGYILGGWSESGISGDKTQPNWDTILPVSSDYWVVKIDAVGNIQWQNRIGGNIDDDLKSIQQTTDGGYILGGTSWSGIFGDKTEPVIGGLGVDYWVIKLNASGNIQWQNTIGGINGDDLHSIQQTGDGGYILGGTSTSSISGDKTENSLGGYDYWVVKLDTSGNIQWQNTIGGSMWDYLYSIQQTVDGGYILGGYSNSDSSGDKMENSLQYDYWVVKLDSIGNIQWQNTIGGTIDDQLYSIQQTSDGGYILGGWSMSGIGGDKTQPNWDTTMLTRDYWIVKIDVLGKIQWQRTIGGSYEDFLISVQQTNDGGYILGGWSGSGISGNKTEGNLGCWDYWVVKVNSMGTILWQKNIGGFHCDMIRQLKQTNDGGYIIAGGSGSSISGDKTENCIGYWDYWVVKLFPDTITGIADFEFRNSDFKVFPNPFTAELIVNSAGLGEIKIFDLTGKEVLLQKTFEEETKINTAHLTPGFYFINYREGERSVNKKVVKM